MLSKKELVRLATLAATLALDYLRWTQLVPMILMWAFMLMMLGGMAVVAFQGEIGLLLERTEPIAERLLGPSDEAAASADEPTELSVDQDRIMPWVLRIWGLLALVGWGLGQLRALIWGARDRWPLRYKLALAGLAAGLSAALVLALALLLDAELRGLHWVLYGIGVPLVLWGVSAWGLIISYATYRLTRLLDRLTGEDDAALWNRPSA